MFCIVFDLHYLCSRKFSIMGKNFKGTVCGVVAAIAYGTNPLFSLNLIHQGMDVGSVLFYRFFFASLILGVSMSLMGVSLRVRRSEMLPLAVAGVVFAMSSVTLYRSFLYMDAGLACSILFVYPILVAVIMTLFFHEKASLLTYGCIGLATVGIAMLYQGGKNVNVSGLGMLLVAASSLCYAVYIVGVDHSVLSGIASARLTFWVLAWGAVMFFALTGFSARLHPLSMSAECLANVAGMALLPTVVPILFINISIKSIGPTYSAIVGAFEPVTALMIGVLVFGEQLTLRVVAGALVILVAVTLIVSRPLLSRSRHSAG